MVQLTILIIPQLLFVGTTKNQKITPKYSFTIVKQTDTERKRMSPTQKSQVYQLISLSTNKYSTKSDLSYWFPRVRLTGESSYRVSSRLLFNLVYQWSKPTLYLSELNKSKFGELRHWCIGRKSRRRDLRFYCPINRETSDKWLPL